MFSQDSDDTCPSINKQCVIKNLPLTPLSTGPVLPPLSAEMVMLIPRAKTTTEAISKPIPGQFVAFDNNPIPDIRRAYSAPTKSSKLPPYETSELVCYCFFRIFYRITEGAFPKPEIFQPFTNAVHLLLCKSGAGMTCLIVALRYIQRLRMSPNLDKDGIQPKPDNYNYTLFVSSLILAQKWIKDDRFSNSYWARSSGLSIAEINKNERQFLNLIGWNLNVSLEDYGKWRKTMQLLGCEHSALVKKTQTEKLKEGVNINAGHQQMLMQYQQQQMAQQNLQMQQQLLLPRHNSIHNNLSPQTQQQFLLPRHNSIHNNLSSLYNTAPRSSSHLHNSNTTQNMDLS